MRHRLGLLGLCLAVLGLISSSCSSSDDDGSHSTAGNAGASGSADHAGSAGNSGAPHSGTDGGGAPPSAGAAGELASGGTSAGAGGAAGSSEAAGASGAFIGVAETACVQHSDCVPVCQHYGWPSAKCFTYCYCVAENGSPTCTPGTTEGCPPGTQCRGGSGCLPYGTGTDDDPCPVGDECAVGYECIGYGNPLPNGNRTACRHLCDNQHPLPADCYSCKNNDYCDPYPAGSAGAPN